MLRGDPGMMVIQSSTENTRRRGQRAAATLSSQRPEGLHSSEVEGARADDMLDLPRLAGVDDVGSDMTRS